MYGSSILRTVQLYEHPIPELAWIIEVPLYSHSVISMFVMCSREFNGG